MKRYIKQGIFLAIFMTIAFVSTTKVADAFAMNLGIGFGFGTQTMYGNFGYNVPVNCFNAGYPCNGNFGNPAYNYIPQNVQYTNMYNLGYAYPMASPVYYNTGIYYDQAPMRTTGGYMQNNMYSTYNNMYSNWYGY